jgi:transposase
MENPMPTNVTDIKSLKTLRDELKLKIHLAAMDVKSEWQRLEPQIERALSSTAIVSGEVIADLEKRINELKSRLST